MRYHKLCSVEVPFFGIKPKFRDSLPRMYQANYTISRNARFNYVLATNVTWGKGNIYKYKAYASQMLLQDLHKSTTISTTLIPNNMVNYTINIVIQYLCLKVTS